MTTHPLLKNLEWGEPWKREAGSVEETRPEQKIGGAKHPSGKEEDAPKHVQDLSREDRRPLSVPRGSHASVEATQMVKAPLKPAGDEEEDNSPLFCRFEG